jgi:hypothetical protein
MAAQRTPPTRSRRKRKPLYETNYYILSKSYGSAEDQSAHITVEPKLPHGSHNWRTGHMVKFEITEALIYEIHPDHEGNLLPYYNELSHPLMADDLINVLQNNGVNNLETFPAIIREVRTGKEHTNYKAVNIIGLVSAADGASETADLGLGGDGLYDTWFKSLVIDEDKAGGYLLFRMAEKVSTILIHKKVKEAIEAAEILRGNHLRFFHPARWSG